MPGDPQVTKESFRAELERKAEAADNWCENATGLTGTTWRYLKVPQKEFEALRPDQLGDLEALRGQ